MQVTYDGEHSVLIGNLTKVTNDPYQRSDIYQYDESNFKDLWTYYGLIPKERPVIAPPEIQESTVEVPGSNGVVDLSDVLLGHPLYYNRSGSLDFYVDHTHPTYTTWENLYDRLLNDFHGFKKQLVLRDAMGYYYDGRIKVNQWKSDKVASSITLDYNFAPYKRMIFTTAEDWLWDPFDFVNGTIPDKQGWYIRTVNEDTTAASTYTILDSAKAGTMPVVPDILLENTNGSQVDFDNLSDENKPRIYFATGDSELEIASKLTNNTTSPYYVSYIKNSERVGDTKYTLKHDPIISIGGPTAQFWGIRLVNPNSFSIKMTIDFRQGRL